MQEIDELFGERWQDPAALTRLPWQTLHDRIRRVPRIASPLPAAPPAPPRSGTCTVQILRTYPARRPPSPFAPRGERSIARAYAKALDRAQRLIYSEDQYLWSTDVARLFAAALRRAPHLQLIAVVPRYPDVEGHTYLELLREHLDLDGRTNGDPAATDDHLLLDPERAARTVRQRAAALDAWHAGGRRGPRPPGRLRRHGLPTAERPAAWTRWLTTPAYRAFLDPDGRPLGMRLRRSY